MAHLKGHRQWLDTIVFGGAANFLKKLFVVPANLSHRKYFRSFQMDVVRSIFFEQWIRLVDIFVPMKVGSKNGKALLFQLRGFRLSPTFTQTLNLPAMALQFHIQLAFVSNPPVWRRIVVPEQFSFWRFHLVIQEAFGWWNAHLFQFSPEGWRSEKPIGLKGDWDEVDTQDCKKIKLSQIFKEPGQTYVYIYDFGDNWEHQLRLENVTAEKLAKADVLEGEGRCPPEDCGGWPGYENLKEVLANPNHPEYYEMRDWLQLGPRQKWNPAAFDLKKTKTAVRKV